MSKDFLEINDIEQRVFDRLFIQENDELESLNLPEPNKPGEVCKTIKPTYGFCLKTRKENGEKVFLNICHSSELPKPPEITEELLRALIDSGDPTTYRIPMSLADGREERDKGNRTCIAHDVVINTEFYNECMENQIFKKFLITVTLDGIEEKYNVTLAKDAYVVLKNKKYHGATMPVHSIKFRPKPLVTELGGSTFDTKKPINIPQLDNKLGPSTENSTKTPSYIITRYPVDANPEFLSAVISLPGVNSVDELSLDLGEDRIVLTTEKNSYNLDIFLPYFIDQDNSKAQFNKTTQTLKIKMPVPPKT